MNTQIGRTRKAKTKTIEISFHSENAFSNVDAHPAINVKVYSLPEVDAPEDVKESAYGEATETFWSSAQFLAHKHGYSGVFSEGRSSGWCVPFYQIKNGEVQKFASYPGQGPFWGYPTYPDVYDPKERKRFVRFRADLLQLLETSKNWYVHMATSRG